MIPQDTIDKVLDRADIVDVIGEYVKLTKKGRDYVALKADMALLRYLLRGR